MKQPSDSDTYFIDSDGGMVRLERQAAIYGTTDDLVHLALRGDEGAQDVGCGAGSITRTIARAAALGRTTGIDREPRYIEYARRTAVAKGVGNADFVTANLLSLPFADDTFDVVWSKHVLQWMAEPDRAIAEFARVTRPQGGL